jgi:4-amino-4-deoxy-L-arabinose transferase-like glycosyltransferase
VSHQKPFTGSLRGTTLAALVAAAVAIAVRLWASGLPLILTNDSLGYLQWGHELHALSPSTIPPMRTPGYPLFLAGVFSIGGESSPPILVAQHALGALTAALVAWAGARLAGPIWGAASGALAGCASIPLTFECYALTESLAVFLTVAGFTLALVGGGRAGTGVLLGVTLGAASLVRPSAALPAIFFALTWVLRRPAWRERSKGALAVASAAVLVVSPWIIYNAQRGVVGLAEGTGPAMWTGLARHGLLDDSYPLPAEVAGEYQRLKAGGWDEESMHVFLSRTSAWHGPNAALLGRWARSSCFSHFPAYARALGSVLADQLDLDARRGRSPGNETAWYMWRLTQDGRARGQAHANFQVGAAPPEMDRFAMETRPSAASRWLGWIVAHRIPGIPQVPLLLAALIFAVFRAVRGDWLSILPVAGTLALFLVHVIMLMPVSRYALPAWVCWYVLVAPVGRGAVAIAEGWRSRRSAA